MMPTTATRRAASSAGPGSSPSASRRPRVAGEQAAASHVVHRLMVPRAEGWRRTIMAGESPPHRPPRKAGTKASQRPAERARDRHQAKVSGCTAPSAKSTSPDDRHPQHEDVDGDEVEREGPGGGADVSGCSRLLATLELPRQAEEGERRQPAGRPPEVIEGGRRRRRRAEVGVGGAYRLNEGRRAWSKAKRGDGAADDGQRGGELDHRLGRDRQHQAAVRLVGVDVKHPEEHWRRPPSRDRDDQRGAACRLPTAPLGGARTVSASKLMVIAFSCSASRGADRTAAADGDETADAARLLP